jgi:hypothetical protein
VLAAAMAKARKLKGPVVLAKLDRLGRDVHYVSGLMKHAALHYLLGYLLCCRKGRYHRERKNCETSSQPIIRAQRPLHLIRRRRHVFLPASSRATNSTPGPPFARSRASA